MKYNDVDFCIISLKKHEHRRNVLIAKMRELQIECRISDAVNGREISAEEYFSQFRVHSSKFFGRKFLTPSELGCFLSHKKALSEFIDGNKSWLVVLEDDVIPDENAEVLLDDIASFKSRCVYILGGQNGLSSFRRVVLGCHINNTQTRSVLLLTYRWLYRTCCYCIDKETAKEILQLMNNSTFFCDDWRYILKNISVKSVAYGGYFIHPLDLNSSSIEAERIYISKK
ncbi:MULTISPECIES: glycosyltransferase family 25 protein [Citrobacter]|uniref:glycosyltransferase family 25 protein n=1 Tax=Citrobacter TaxID=544 RepID=UPI0007913973|nr:MULTISPECIES: glycosyltransferase family 25 protein [Citrobacter]SAC93511.1 Glycosyltransferase family 25 (LPS biosynthesis protein) [Enterobacter cloacae]KAA0568390.1 glycosyltransferase family 25 protein [Citrobacter portucalensis]MDM2796625.1 glycosyltransferase family 25 protein [Citrobacter sp. Cpo131]MDM2891294.1 glycosyltransferase family 25 protein [Citrobacter sp. Cpo060]MDW2648566.1 glycosyltransferase family 25 protein [Citrobacter portucalensis]